MNFAEYAPLALRTAKMMPTVKENIEHVALGMCTEFGEIATVVKRHRIYGRPMTPEMLANIKEEIGDYCWYVALGTHVIGGDVQDLLQLRTHMTFDDEELAEIGTLQGLLGVLFASAGLVWGAFMGGDTDTMTDMVYAAVEGAERLCKELGIDFGEALDENIAKLRLRFPDAYSDEAAEARADKGGLDARNS